MLTALSRAANLGPFPGSGTWQREGAVARAFEFALQRDGRDDREVATDAVETGDAVRALVQIALGEAARRSEQWSVQIQHTNLPEDGLWSALGPTITLSSESGRNVIVSYADVARYVRALVTTSGGARGKIRIAILLKGDVAGAPQ